jgi:biopolymer transport protein TolR
MGEINVVPYIDVMLVLLIIFMITAPLMTQGIKVELPRAAAEPLDLAKVRNQQPLVVSIDRRGQLFLSLGGDPKQPVDARDAAARVTALVRRTPELPILVNGDKSVPYGRVVEVMVMLRQAGANRLGFITDPLPADATGR